MKPVPANGTSLATEAQLDELHRQSVLRQEELRLIAAELPAAMSRRALVKKMVGSVREAPDKPMVAKRVALKLVRAPLDLVRRKQGR